MSRIGQTYNAKNEKVYPKIVIGSIIHDPSVDNSDETNHAFTDAVGEVVSSELAKEDGVSLRKINLAGNGSITNNGVSNIISVGQKVEITTNNLESTHIDASSLSIKDANVSNLSVGDVSVGNIIVTNNSYDILKQYRELPDASSEYAGKVVQYIGPTHHEEEDGFVCYSMVKCVMGYDASESLNSMEYMMSDFDSFDSIITHKWLTENGIKCYSESGPDKTYEFDLIWKNNSYLVEVENQSGERVLLGDESVQSPYLRHIYCPYVWNTDFIPSQTDGVLLSYKITFHTSTYVWKPQTPRKLETVSLESISLSETFLPMYDIQDGYELYVNFNPANATNKKVTWESDNSSVVSVSNGIIQPHAVGTAKITATSDDGGHMASCDVSVIRYIGVESVDVSQIVVGVDGSVDANDYCTISPDKYTLTNPQIIYTIDNEDIATCSSNGIITGHSRGDTSLTVRVITMLDDVIKYDQYGTNTIKVCQPLKGISIDKSVLKLGYESRETVNVTIVPNDADIESINWEYDSDYQTISVEYDESDPYIATILSGNIDYTGIIQCTVNPKVGDSSFVTCDVKVSGGTSPSSTVKDKITCDMLKIGTGYTDFSRVTSNSAAIYAGKAYKDGANNIQLRSKNSDSGIVSTTSCGTIESVTINVGTGSGTVDVYGSNTAYTAASNLYNSSTQGTKIGSTSSTGTITFSSDTYEYVGIRSNSGAVYLSSVEIVWKTQQHE